MALDEQLDVITDSLTDGRDRFEHPAQVARSHLEISRFERIPLEAAEPLVDGLDRRFGEVLRLAGAGEPSVRVRADAVAELPAQHAVHRDVQGAGGDVPHGHLESAQCRHGHRTAPPVRVAAQFVDRLGDAERVLPSCGGSEHLHRAAHGVLLAFERRLCHPGEALVGLQDQEDEVGAIEVDDDGLDAGDLHCGYPFTAPAVMPPTTYFCANR